jgi:hypothetical protein
MILVPEPGNNQNNLARKISREIVAPKNNHNRTAIAVQRDVTVNIYPRRSEIAALRKALERNPKSAPAAQIDKCLPMVGTWLPRFGS